MISLAVAAAGWVGVSSPGDYAAIQFLPLPRHDRYVSDMVEALIALMEAHGDLQAIHDPVNLGNPGEFTMLELAQIVLDLTGARSKLVFMPLPKDDPTQRRPDITRARNLLGWEPKMPLIEGLVPTIEYFRAELETMQKRVADARA